jgi:N-acylglucosamine-6-phosphate 2-epimerase
VHPALSAIHDGLVVSCQTSPGNPIKGPNVMALFAQAAEQGGACGIRAEGADDIRSIREVTDLPIIGIRKTKRSADGGVFITPTYATAVDLAAAGSSIIALDGTARPRPDDEKLADIIARIHDELGLPVMADVDSLQSGIYARDCGADVIGTTLSGYTPESPVSDVPDLCLLTELVDVLERPIIAEGRYWSREDVSAAYSAGAFSVVVGSAITNPMVATRRMVAVTPQSQRALA